MRRFLVALILAALAISPAASRSSRSSRSIARSALRSHRGEARSEAHSSSTTHTSRARAPWSALVFRKHLCEAHEEVLVCLQGGLAGSPTVKLASPVARNPRPVWPRGRVRVDRAVLGLVHEAHGDKQDAQGANDPVGRCDLLPARLAREEVLLDTAKHRLGQAPERVEFPPVRAQPDYPSL
jgi:hypothetical protein